MNLSRRPFLIGTGAGLLALAACQEAAPVVLSVRAQAMDGMNRGPDGADRPVTVSVLQLTSGGGFMAADYFALQDPAAALGADLVKADRIVLPVGGAASLGVPIQEGTGIIGVTAGFRDPAGRNVRQTFPVPAASSGLIVSVGPSGISLTAA